jgi:hypothetical protein
MRMMRATEARRGSAWQMVSVVLKREIGEKRTGWGRCNYSGRCYADSVESFGKQRDGIRGGWFYVKRTKSVNPNERTKERGAYCWT